MLSRDAAVQTVQLLSSKTTAVSAIHSQFATIFDLSERMQVYTAIAVLLSQGFLDHYQQVAAVWILYAEF
jgi:hypothetical protein